jgi:hypothetical protein
MRVSLNYKMCKELFIRIYQATNLDKTKGDFEDLIKFSLLKLRHYQPPQKSLNRGK